MRFVYLVPFLQLKYLIVVVNNCHSPQARKAVQHHNDPHSKVCFKIRQEEAMPSLERERGGGERMQCKMCLIYTECHIASYLYMDCQCKTCICTQSPLITKH